MTLPSTTARNASLIDLSALLSEQQAHKHDVVAPADQLVFLDGHLDLEGMPFRLTDIADQGLASRLDMPVKYLRRLRAERPDLFDANVNGWFSGWDHGLPQHPYAMFQAAEPDPRSFLVRTFKNEESGICRAFLSNSFRIMDNLDVLTAALEGVRETGAEVQVEGCDLSERRMRIRLACPDIRAFAPVLLAGYRSPWNHGAERIEHWDDADQLRTRFNTPDEDPILFAGIEISNSETGGGAFQIVPRIVVKICRNGMTVTKDAMRSVHLGSKMDDGIINWRHDTLEANVELVRKQARDAVSTYLDQSYLDTKVRELEAMSGRPVTEPDKVIERVTKQLRISDERRVDVLTHFIMGGQLTSMGVANAITSVAQTVSDPDEAADLEALAIPAMELVAG